MTPKNRENWEATRAKGRTRFILVTGVLGWGLPMFLFMTFWVQKVSVDDVGSIALSMALWAVGGLGFGYWVWRVSEKKYLEAIESEEPNRRTNGS